LVWSGDGVPDIESPMRGRWMGHQVKQEILIPKDDFALALEYLYTGSYEDFIVKHLGRGYHPRALFHHLLGI